MLSMQRIFMVVVVLLSFNLYEANILGSASLVPIVIEAKYNNEYQLDINTNIEYVFLYSVSSETWNKTARIEVESDAIDDTPLIVVVRQRNGILSWQIPLLVDAMHFNTLVYNKTSRTLCPTKYYRSELQDEEEFISVSLTTASRTNISFNLIVTEDVHFYLRLGEKRSVQISPSEPIYYGYTFPEQVESSSVVVHIESDSDICMTVSVKNTSCPVFDLERDIEFSGRWQTVSQQGGIIVSKEDYPLGFFVVLVVKGYDTDCYGSPSMIPLRNKNVTLSVNASITRNDFIIASTVAIFVILGFCLICVVGVVALSEIKKGQRINQDILNNEECDTVDEPIQGPSTIEEISPRQSVLIDEDSSLDEDDIDLMEDVYFDKEVIRTKIVLSVSDLARKEPKILRHKSRLYLYYLATVAIFYALPVVQLVITYQNELHVTGNQDICYYNFLCAHPFGVLSDFNHVFSNFGYIMFGLLFIFVTYTREHNELEKERNMYYGIPQHYGLFYAMGTALIMEGVLSGSYHVCPNRSNFQFDTSFMYIIAVLCMIKIYQTRHPDINARAPITFGVLALMILVGLIGVLNGSTYFWIIFTIMHLLICLFLSIQIYYMGRQKCVGLLRKITRTCMNEAQCGLRYLIRPLYPARFVMLVIANLCNVALAVYGNVRHDQNFATYLLAILMANLILYTLFYIVMKICYRERIHLQPLCYIVVSVVLWTASFYFFINKTITWALTPAQSRLYNKPCVLLNFYDNHDVWHFLSALAMFFSFMVLLTLDDDLVDVHRSQIPVF